MSIKVIASKSPTARSFGTINAIGGTLSTKGDDNSMSALKKKDARETKPDTQTVTAVDVYGNLYEPPEYTMKDILDSIPRECYKRSAATGLYYVGRDITMACVFGYLANTYVPLIANKFLRGLAWFTYSQVQGMIFTGFYTLAHECAHRAFSEYDWLDNFVGWTLDSFILTPYFSFKFSHAKHHKSSAHITKDVVYLPMTKEEFIKKHNVLSLKEITEESPIVTLLTLIRNQLVGWVAYLLTDVSSHPYKGYEKGLNKYKVNHFNPWSPIFKEFKDHQKYVVMSDIGIALQFFVLYKWYKTFGWFSFFIHWLMPWIGNNHWVVFITMLQHGDPTIPHYDDTQWTFARGASATIDRHVPFLGMFFFHGNMEYHVCHHFVSRIPFYNAKKATEGIKKVMGKHYMYSEENMFVALWRMMRWCQFVDGKNGVLMYRNVNNNGVSPLEEE